MSAVSFSQFLATLSDACLVASPHGDILDLNPAACGVLGYRKEELIGKPLPRIFAPESHSKVVEHLEELKITRRLCADKMNVLTKKGEKRIMLLSMGSAVDAEGRLLYSTIMLVDISDQERDTEKLLRYAALLESSDDAIIAKNSEGVILSWNAGAQHIFGYTPEEAIGQSITIIIPPELRDEEIDILRKLRAGERIEHYETLRISKGGRRINVSITVSPIRDAGGRIIGASKIARDITERKLAEEKLREYEKAVEGAEEMIAVVDREGRYLIANRQFLNYRGMTKEQVVGRLVPEVLNKGVFEALVQKQLDECFLGKVVRYEMKYTYPELGERDLFISYFPIEGAAGVERAACILQDISERKRTEEALRKSEERFRLAAKAGRMYAYEWDVSTDIVMRSEEDVNVLGFSKQAEPLTRQQLLATVHPDDRALFVSSVGQATPENPTTHILYRALRPDGSVIWLEKNAKAFFDEQGRMLRMIGMVADITERKRTEEALRESDERLRLAVRAGRMYAFDWDAATDLIVRSGECADIFNWMNDPTRDTGQQFAARVHPEDYEAYAAPETVLTPGNPVYQTSYRVLGPDGSVIWLEATGHVSFDSEGKIRRIIGMVADVTERKLAEEALFTVSRRLIDAQEQERARVARELHDDLSQRMALLSISLEQFERGMPDLSSQARQHLHKIAEAATEVSSNIHDLSHQLHPYMLDTLGLVASLENFCRELSGQNNLQVEFVHNDIPGQIPKDVTLCLFRIVQEALRNVVKHSGAAEAKVELSGHGDRIDLCISDSGAGFSPKSAEGGAGLGLISMRERLRLVGGQLSVESEPTQGTRVRVRVPLLIITSGVTSEGKARKAEA